MPKPHMTDPKHIAVFLSTSGHSGVDRLAKHLLPALGRRGYRVDLLKVRRHGPELNDDEPSVRVVDLGHRHTYACVPNLVRYLRREQPMLMLSDKDRVNRTALLARALAGVGTRLILRSGTTISIDLASRGILERWLQRTSIRLLYPYADRIIVPSLGAAEDMAQYTGLARRLIQVVPSPVVPESLFTATLPAPQHHWFHEPAIPLILGAGELGVRKDFETLLRGFARLRITRRCRLMIIGRGRERDRLLALAAQLGIAEDVELPGFVAKPYPYLANADLFAFTSRWEGLPLVLVEALALGTPVVATDCPSGPRETLQNGYYGRLIPVGDDLALADAMAATLDSPLPAEKLKEAARPYAIEAATDAYLKVMTGGK
jgi:glycosyltransferase involved in cell wall biosynthesis